MRLLFPSVLLFLSVSLTAGPFRFVQITDLHWGSTEHNRRLSAAITMIRKLPWKIDFLVVTGDLTMENITEPGVAKNIQSEFKKTGLPVRYLAGNHDILGWRGQDRLRESRRVYEKHFSPLAYAIQHKGVVLLFSFMENIREKYTLPGYDAWGWLQASLQRYRTRPVLLFHHSPPTRDFYFAGLQPHNKGPWVAENRGKYQALVNRYGNVKGVFCGHFHRDDLHRIGKVPLYSAPSIAGYWGRQASFRVYTYDNGEISYLTVYVQ